MLGPNSRVSPRVKLAAANTLSVTLWNGASGLVRCRLRLLQLHQHQCPPRTVVWSQSDGDLLAGSISGIARKWRHQQPSTIRSGLLRSATLPVSRFASPSAAVHPLPSAHTSTADSQMGYNPTTVMNTLSDPPLLPSYGESADMNCDSPNEIATPTLMHFPSSTDSSSGDRTIQMSSFIDEPHRPIGPMNKIFAPMMPLAMPPSATAPPRVCTCCSCR